MRQENGMRFDRCTSLQDRDAVSGEVFDANVLTCHDKPLNAGEIIRVGVAGRSYRYDGDDSLGNSIFTPLEPFPEFERVEKPYKDNLGTSMFGPTCRAARLRAATHGNISNSRASSKPAKRRLKQVGWRAKNA